MISCVRGFPNSEPSAHLWKSPLGYDVWIFRLGLHRLIWGVCPDNVSEMGVKSLPSYICCLYHVYMSMICLAHNRHIVSLLFLSSSCANNVVTNYKCLFKL